VIFSRARVARIVHPPDFRYVWLSPGRGSLTLALGAATAALAGMGVLLWSSGHHPLSISVVASGAALAGAVVRRGDGARTPTPGGAREVTMAIVPWGVIIDPDGEPRVLRWPAVSSITVETAHTLRGGTPAVVASVVTVATGRERLAGRTSGAAGLERLTVNLEAYAEEAARPVALDLEGLEAAGVTEPVAGELLARAGELCTTGRGAARLALPAGGYRSMSTAAAGPETLALLRAILAPGAMDGAPADARPLAAMVAVLLGAHELVPELLRLVSAPHPLVAAVAKAAAIRLGAPQSRAGAVEEVAAFLFEEDHERLERWASEEPRAYAASGSDPNAAARSSVEGSSTDASPWRATDSQRMGSGMSPAAITSSSRRRSRSLRR
jgi:hypothetical protein